MGCGPNVDNELAGVHIRVGNLIAALAGAFDGEVSWEDADLWLVTVPAMVASRDADSALRILLSDHAHFTMARKAAGQPAHLLVDEFAAIAVAAASPSTSSSAAGAPASPSPARARPPSAARRSGPGCWPPRAPSCCFGPGNPRSWPPWPGPSAWRRGPGRSTGRS
jgi:hypothetical protein